MAEENELDQPQKKSKTMLIVIIVVVVNLVIGGVVVVVMMSGGGEKAAPAATGGGEDVSPVPRMAGDGPGPLIQMDNFVVNIQSDEGSKYLKAAIVVELAGPEAQDAFKPWEQLVRNEVLVFLSSLEVAETITVKQKRLVEKRLRGIINKRIGADAVAGVYFTEFVTQ
jgi:flagellar FliL protein